MPIETRGMRTCLSRSVILVHATTPWIRIQYKQRTRLTENEPEKGKQPPPSVFVICTTVHPENNLKRQYNETFNLLCFVYSILMLIARSLSLFMCLTQKNLRSQLWMHKHLYKYFIQALVTGILCRCANWFIRVNFYTTLFPVRPLTDSDGFVLGQESPPGILILRYRPFQL